MEYPMLAAGGFILFGLLCIYLFNNKTIKKQKTYWEPKDKPFHPSDALPMAILSQQRTKELTQYMEHGRLSLQYGSKELGTVATHIENEYPYLSNTIDQIRELQGCLYLMNNYFKQGNHTIEQIRDYETFLLKKYYENQQLPIDIPTNNRWKI